MRDTLESINFTVTTLVDEQVTAPAINAAMSRYTGGKTAENGCFYVMFSGHGVLDNAGKAVFCCHDYSEDNAFMTSFPFDTVPVIAARVAKRHQVYHLDCCHAGGLLANINRGAAEDWPVRAQLEPLLLPPVLLVLHANCG